MQVFSRHLKRPHAVFTSVWLFFLMSSGSKVSFRPSGPMQNLSSGCFALACAFLDSCFLCLHVFAWWSACLSVPRIQLTLSFS